MLAIEEDTDWKRGIPWILILNHSQLPNIFILLSFFCSLSHYFKVQKVDIGYIEVFWSKGWGYLWKSVEHWGSYDLKQVIFLITHNYIILLFYIIFGSLSQCLYLIILRLLWIKRWGSFIKNLGNWGSYGLKHGNCLQNLKNHS